MTSKELIYIEDALGHEQYFQTQCQHSAQMLSDPGLRQAAEDMCAQHQRIFSQLYGLLSEQS